MIELSIPGMGSIHLEHLVCDVNGTLAEDGKLINGVCQSIANLRDQLTIHLLTADTFGKQAHIDRELNLTAIRLKTGSASPANDEAKQKAAYIDQLGADRVVAIGQGANDALMLRAARIGICVLSPEGTALDTLLSANLVTPNIDAAFKMLENPLRLVATLRR